MTLALSLMEKRKWWKSRGMLPWEHWELSEFESERPLIFSEAKQMERVGMQGEECCEELIGMNNSIAEQHWSPSGVWIMQSLWKEIWQTFARDQCHPCRYLVHFSYSFVLQNCHHLPLCIVSVPTRISEVFIGFFQIIFPVCDSVIKFG